VIVTEQLAKKLFPEDSGLGKTIFIASHPMQIVGLLRHLARPSYVGEDASQNTVLLPVLPKSERGMILIARLRDGELVSRHNLVGQLGDAFGAVSEGQVRWEISDFGAIRAKHFASDSAAMIVLAVISTALIVVSGFGVSGLSSYWMQLRIRQVATRRALGATRSQIIQYYLLENALLCTGGCVVGIVCAFLISVYLALIFNSRLLPLWYLLADSTAILVLSQISTIGSIRRVASVPPALASRL
jgi:putative ABC transport system permease protein